MLKEGSFSRKIFYSFVIKARIVLKIPFLVYLLIQKYIPNFPLKIVLYFKTKSKPKKINNLKE